MKKKKIKERKVGEVFRQDGKMYKVVGCKESCLACDMYDGGLDNPCMADFGISGMCWKRMRSDNQQVIFELRMEEVKEKRMKMYLSFPITGRNIQDVKAYAKRVKQIWVAKGYDVITPFEVSPEEGRTYAYYMGRDVEALLGCDGIILCQDWFSSKGCRLEYNVAEIYGKIVRVDHTRYMGRQEDGKENQV